MARIEDNMDDMEQYGVWVKVQPEVIDESVVDLDEETNTYQLSDIESENIPEDFNQDDDLSASDQNLSENSFEEISLDMESEFPEEESLELPDDNTDFSLKTEDNETDLLDTKQDLNIPEEEGLEFQEEDNLEFPEEDVVEFPVEDELALPDTENSILSEETELDLPEEDNLEITDIPDETTDKAMQTTSDFTNDDISSSLDSFEEVSLDDFIEDGFTDPNKNEENSEQAKDEQEPIILRDEELVDEITDEDFPEIDVDLTQLEDDSFEEENLLDPKNIASDEILNDNLDDMLESEELDLSSIEEFESTAMPTAENEIDEIDLDEIQETDTEESLQELELEMDDELNIVDDADFTELDTTGDFDDLNLEESLDMEQGIPSSTEIDDLVLDENVQELPDDLDIESDNQDDIEAIDLGDTSEMEVFEELDIEDDFKGEEISLDADVDKDIELEEPNEELKIEELALDDISGELDIENKNADAIEELILDDDFSGLSGETAIESDSLDDLNAADELIFNEELPDTVEEADDSIDHILDIDEEGESLKTKADSLENIDELNLEDNLDIAMDMETGDDLSELGEFDSEIELDTILTDTEAPDTEVIEVSLSDEDNIDRSQFEDFSEIEEEITAVPEAALKPVTSGELSLLQKIEKELSLIKNELSGLKTELAQLRKGKGISQEPDTQEVHGFFDEEEDETIALTGDELNNILNTADITEEMAEEEASSSMDNPDFTSGSGEDTIGDTTIEKIALKEVPVDETWNEAPVIQKHKQDDLSGVQFDEATMDETALEEQDEEIIIDVSDSEENAIIAENIPEEEIVLEMPGDETESALKEYTDLSTEELELDYNKEEPQPVMSSKEKSKVPQDKKSDSLKSIPENLKNELKSVLAYMDQLLEALPEEKIKEFANSDYFNTYKKLFEELGLTN